MIGQGLGLRAFEIGPMLSSHGDWSGLSVHGGWSVGQGLGYGRSQHVLLIRR